MSDDQSKFADLRYIPHNYSVPQVMPHAILQTHSSVYPFLIPNFRVSIPQRRDTSLLFFIILLLFAGYILNLSLIQLSSAFVSWMKDVIYSPSLEIY